MNDKIIDTIIAAFAKELISESKELFKDMYDEGKQFIGKDLTEYLEKQKNRYSHIKTLLRGNTPVFLYDVYYPIKLRNYSEIIDTNNINNVFCNENFITIIGDAGSGKSTLTKHLFINSIKESFAIPILVELRYLNESDGNVEKYILEKIFENKIAANTHILERLLIKGKFVFFLDGYDELNSEIKQNVTTHINSFVNKYINNKYILTSRPYSNIESMPLFKNYRIKELSETDGEIFGFIDIQLLKETELADKIKKSLEDNKSTYIQSFLTNPLLLTLYILTFQTNAEIPNKKYIFYRRVINALFSEHDSKTKIGYVREKQTKLTQEQFEDILKAFCFLSYFDNQYDFDYDYVNTKLKIVKTKLNNITFDNNEFLNDMTSAISLWTEDNGIYGFAHRSLQEYFSALFIKNLNPNDNERAYKRIIDRFSDKSRSWEVKNFLSLCEEMDEVNFLKFYYLPLLLELYGYFNFTDDSLLAKSIVLYFTNGLYLKKGKFLRNESVSVRDHVYKSIYIHIPFTQDLHHQLSLLCSNKYIINSKQVNKNVSKSGEWFLSLNNEMPEDLTKIIINSKIIKICISFAEYVKQKITEAELKIYRSTNADKELIDLI